MSSTSKSYGRKGNFIPISKQRLQVKQPTRNWLELPSDIMVNILQRLSVVDILEKAQKVCTAWREICKDPAIWRRIYMGRFPFYRHRRRKRVFREMCKLAVDRSQGQLLDLTIVDFCNYELLQYVSDRSSQLRRLEIISCYDGLYNTWSNPLKKLPLLEELSLVRRTNFSPQDIEAAGSFCPLLKTLKLNQKTYNYNCNDFDDASLAVDNAIALAVGKNLPGLTHLELIGNYMNNIGLEAILDGCCHLESLDLRRCMYLDLKGDLGKRCSLQIKFLKLPRDSFERGPHYAYFDFIFDSDSDDDHDELIRSMAFVDMLKKLTM